MDTSRTGVSGGLPRRQGTGETFETREEAERISTNLFYGAPVEEEPKT
jgi:hypothetical protein